MSTLPGPSDEQMMDRALHLAERGWGRVAPNPLVGAVIVRDGEIVGEGWHAEFGQAHAEAMALEEAGERARGATMYVTLEPCSHFGKTPPCTQAILDAGISRVVIACEDPHTIARGGAEILTDSGLDVERNVRNREGWVLNAPYFFVNSDPLPDRPWIELKLALSLDGRIADAQGDSGWITGPEARAEVHRLRSAHDAVSVGIGTVLKDDPRLTVRDAPEPRVAPTRVIFDRRLRTPADSHLFDDVDTAPILIVTGLDVDPARVADLESAGASVLPSEDLRDGLGKLWEQGIRSIFSEGGGTFASHLLQQNLVNRLTLFFAPLFLGPGGLDPFARLSDVPLEDAERWRLVRSERFGEDAMISLER